VNQDAELLSRYATDHSESAFSELIRQHVDLVYSAALRMVNGDVHRAQDVTQQVFSELARQAKRLAKHPALAGWLYTTTRLMAMRVNRTEQRRKAREQEANAMNELLREPAREEPDWERLGPVLEDAMHELGEKDRFAVLLRFFQNKSLKEVGAALDMNENAARMRVERALEKLRLQLQRRRVTSTTATLAAVLATNAVAAAPPAFVTTLASASLVGTAAATGTTLTALKLITMTKLQTAIVSAAVVAGVATPLVIQHESKLRQENLALRQQVDQLAGLTTENERLSNLIAQANNTRSLSSNEMNDLLRLRGEVGMLRRQTNELGKLREENRRLQVAPANAGQKSASPNPAEDRAGQVDFPRESWAFAGYANPESAILSLASAALGGDMETFLNSLTPDFQTRQRQKWEPKSDVEIRDKLVKEFGGTKAIRLLNKEAISENEIILSLLIQQDDGRNEMPKMKVQRIGNEWKMAGPYEPPGPKAP